MIDQHNAQATASRFLTEKVRRFTPRFQIARRPGSAKGSAAGKRSLQIVQWVVVGALLLGLGAIVLPQTSSAAGAYACGNAMAPDQTTANSELQRGYTAWKSAYITPSGAGGYLRVQRTENGNDTVSEGIGYGMLLSAYLNDRATFDGLWRYAKSHLDANGLMHWRIDSGNNVIGSNAATDADEDMALGLIVADATWGGYRADALALIGRIMQYEVEPGTFVLKPGDVWGGSQVTNPSYFAPAYYKVFQSYGGDTRWSSVADQAYQVIANVNAQSGAGRTGLQPDWTTATGTPASGMGYNYTYDATRAPWRLAVDAAWFCDTRATGQLAKINAFFQGVGATNIKDGYRLDGTLAGQWHNAAFVAPAASGAIMSTSATYRSAMWNETVGLTYGNYYNDSLRALGLLLMSGNMRKPGGVTTTSAPTATSTTAAPTATSKPTATPASAPTSTPASGGGVKAQYYAGNTDPLDNQIASKIQLVNTGTENIPLSQLTIRYWYTREGDQPTSYWCDWAALGCANVTARFVRLATARAGADTYMELGFTSAAGALAPGGSTGEIQSRFAKSDWSNYDERNDYSYSQAQTAFVDWTKVTIYRNGMLIWGKEP